MDHRASEGDSGGRSVDGQQFLMKAVTGEHPESSAWWEQCERLLALLA